MKKDKTIELTTLKIEYEAYRKAKKAKYQYEKFITIIGFETAWEENEKNK